MRYIFFFQQITKSAHTTSITNKNPIRNFETATHFKNRTPTIRGRHPPLNKRPSYGAGIFRLNRSHFSKIRTYLASGPLQKIGRLAPFDFEMATVDRRLVSLLQKSDNYLYGFFFWYKYSDLILFDSINGRVPDNAVFFFGYNYRLFFVLKYSKTPFNVWM